jgi:hypothetical protein
MKTGSFVVRVGDEGGAHTILTINADGTVGNFFTGAFHTMPSTTDTQHVYRVAQSANSGQFDLWIDNNYVTSFLGNSQLGTGGNHWWSDGSGSTSGEYEMDYVRYRAGGTSPTGFTPDANRIVWMSGSLARWDDSVNWNNSNSTPGAPNSNQVTAVFGGANVASRTVDLDGNFTVKGLEFAASNTNRYGLVGLGSLTLSSNSGNASIAVLGSSAAGHQIQVATTLASNTDLSTVPGARIDFNNLLNLGGRTLNIAAGSTVNINNNLDSGTSGTVSNTGTLGGNGRVNGSLTNSGGTVSPGLDVGIFTVDGNFTQSSTGTLAVDLASETSFDVLNVLGSATLDGTLDISLLGFEPTESDTFTILKTTGGIIDNGLVVTGGTGLSYSVVGNNLVLSFQESLPGDFDGDGDVDGRDFLAWQRGSSPSPFSSIDLAAWQSAYNGGALAAATTVPEPTCLVILGVTCCIGTLLRRKVAL